MQEEESGQTLVDSITGGELVESDLRELRLERGTIVDRYLVQGELGSGGMGMVYAAYDPELDRSVALKLLHARPGSAHARGRLLREARAIAKLRHPNVVTVYDVGTFEGRVFLVMELVQGVTLRRWLQQTRPSWRDVLAVLEQAGRGLEAAHDGELVHRDFKPDNVLVDARGRAVVLDFGLARRLGTNTWGDEEPSPRQRAGTESIRTGARVGTPAYMAPEQDAGHPTDARADQFAFCVVAWEALLGGRPSSSGARAGEAGRVRVPRAVRVALRRGLAAHPDERHADMRALLHALAEAAGRPRAHRGAIFWVASALLGVAAFAWGSTRVSLVQREPGREVSRGNDTSQAPRATPAP